MRIDNRLPSRTRGLDETRLRSSAPASDPKELVIEDIEELEADDLEIEEIGIDEAALPPLDLEDPEQPLHDHGHGDLLDQSWLERMSEDDPEDEGRSVEDVGLTIDIDDLTDDEDETAQVVDLDVGSLLTSLPSDGTELELDLGGGIDRDGTLGIGALRDMLLPEEELDEEGDDRDVGIDERFPVFDDASDIEPRRAPDDGDDVPEGELT